MIKSEHSIQSAIMVAVSKYNCTIFRTNVGTVVLVGTNLNSQRVIIPVASIDSITEVVNDID